MDECEQQTLEKKLKRGILRVKKKRCPKFVQDAAELLEEIV
jgi:hypothetical protein